MKCVMYMQVFSGAFGKMETADYATLPKMRDRPHGKLRPTTEAAAPLKVPRATWRKKSRGTARLYTRWSMWSMMSMIIPLMTNATLNLPFYPRARASLQLASDWCLGVENVAFVAGTWIIDFIDSSTAVAPSVVCSRSPHAWYASDYPTSKNTEINVRNRCIQRQRRKMLPHVLPIYIRA
jgi:hypothetical protein